MDKIYYKKIVEKYLEGNASQEEIELLTAWLRDDKDIANLWSTGVENSDAAIDNDLQSKMFDLIKSGILNESEDTAEIDNKSFRKTIILSSLKWAAMICIPICIALFTYYLANVYLSDASGINSKCIVNVDNGNRANIVLPDGSHVTINSASKLTYNPNNFGENRNVALDGEALFNVKHDKDHPFTVNLSDLEIEVLGTEFNISSYSDENDIIVVLLTGKVEVNTASSSTIMKPGEKLKYNKITKQSSTEQVYAQDFSSWTRGNLYFQNESMKDIMKTLSRVYNVRIRIDSPRMGAERFTGTIPEGSIQDALNIIRTTYPFRYKVENSLIVITE